MLRSLAAGLSPNRVERHIDASRPDHIPLIVTHSSVLDIGKYFAKLEATKVIAPMGLVTNIATSSLARKYRHLKYATLLYHTSGYAHATSEPCRLVVDSSRSQDLCFQLQRCVNHHAFLIGTQRPSDLILVSLCMQYYCAVVAGFALDLYRVPW